MRRRYDIFTIKWFVHKIVIAKTCMEFMLPEYVKSLPLGLLHLSSRSQNSLEKAQVVTVGDLFALPNSSLGKVPGLGPQGIEMVLKIKMLLQNSIRESGEVDWFYYWDNYGIKVIPQGFSSDVTEAEVLESLPLLIEEILQQNPDERLWFILQRRLGLKGTTTLTLEELGLVFDLTRERVRQLEDSALTVLRAVLIQSDYKNKAYHVHPRVLSAINNLILIVTERTGQAVREDVLLSQIENTFSISSTLIKSSLYLVLNLSGLLKIEFSKNDLQPIWGKFKPSEISAVQDSVECLDRLLTENSLPLSEIDTLVQLNKSLRKKHRLSLEQLKNLTELCSTIEQHGEGYYWGSFKHLKSRSNQVERILFEHGKPLHINQIVRELNHRLTLHGKKIVAPGNLVNQISSNDYFVPIGRSGEWGLSSWSMDTSTIVDLMKQYLIARNEPATADEIYLYVSERRPVQKSSISAYLAFNKGFMKVGRVKWGISGWLESKGAQNWNPEHVGRFIEELFKKSKAIKLKYSVVKQALVEASGVADRQARGLLNVNPVIETQRDESGELFAIFQPTYKDLLSERGAHFSRKKSTLKVLVNQKVREMLEESPGNQIALSELIDMLVKKFNKRDKTFYNYISRLDYVEKFIIPDTKVVMCRIRRNKSSFPFPEVESIQTLNLRQKVDRALTFLNKNDVDISLFLLSKEFEAALKNYLLAGQLKGKFPTLPSKLSLDGMINFIKSENIITDQAILHFLRQRRNDRAHGTMPTENEREVMMKHAKTTAGMYVDYIKYFDDLEQGLM